MIADTNLDADVQALKVDSELLSALASVMKAPITADEAAFFSELDQQVNREMESLALRLASQERNEHTWN
jgi:hypothetical protein